MVHYKHFVLKSGAIHASILVGLLLQAQKY